MSDGQLFQYQSLFQTPGVPAAAPPSASPAFVSTELILLPFALLGSITQVPTPFVPPATAVFSQDSHLELEVPEQLGEITPLPHDSSGYIAAFTSFDDLHWEVPEQLGEITPLPHDSSGYIAAFTSFDDLHWEVPEQLSWLTDVYPAQEAPSFDFVRFDDPTSYVETPEILGWVTQVPHEVPAPVVDRPYFDGPEPHYEIPEILGSITEISQEEPPAILDRPYFDGQELYYEVPEQLGSVTEISQEEPPAILDRPYFYDFVLPYAAPEILGSITEIQLELAHPEALTVEVGEPIESIELTSYLSEVSLDGRQPPQFFDLQLPYEVPQQLGYISETFQFVPPVDAWPFYDHVDVPFFVPEQLGQVLWPDVADVWTSPLGDTQLLWSTIRTRFKNLVSSVVPVLTQNDNEGVDPAAATLWCRLEIDEKDTLHPQIGRGNWYRRRGYVHATFHVPKDAGDKLALEAAAVFVSAFRNTKASQIVYRQPEIYRIGVLRDSRWWRVQVSCPWYRDYPNVPIEAPVGTPFGDVKELVGSVQSRFRDLIETPSGVATQYDDAPFTIPDDATWIRFSVQPGTQSQAEINNTRTYGFATAMIFVPLGAGDGRALELADLIVPAFRSRRDTGVVFRTPSVMTVGRTEKWWQLNVRCPFYADEIVS